MIDQSNTPELRAAVESLFFGYRAFTSRPDRLLAQRGLGRVHHRILYFVGRQPQIAVNALLTSIQTRHLAAAFSAAGDEATRGWLAVMQALPEQL